MFERFTDRARRVVVLAQDEARMLEHDYIGTEHVLLGLIHEGSGVAAKALQGLDIDLGALAEEVKALAGRGDTPPSGHIPFTPRAKKSLELALRESLQLGHDFIGTEHLLLGVIREGEGVAAQVLVQRGADLDAVRQKVTELLQAHQGAARPRRSRTAWGSVTLEEISLQLRALGQRLSAIEEKLGIEESPARKQLRHLELSVTRIRRQKETAIDEQDFERAARLRDREKKILASMREAQDAWFREQDERDEAVTGELPPDAATGTAEASGTAGSGEEPPEAASGGR